MKGLLHDDVLGDIDDDRNFMFLSGLARSHSVIHTFDHSSTHVIPKVNSQSLDRSLPKINYSSQGMGRAGEIWLAHLFIKPNLPSVCS